MANSLQYIEFEGRTDALFIEIRKELQKLVTLKMSDWSENTAKVLDKLKKLN